MAKDIKINGEYVLVEVEKLHPWPGNPRVITRQAREAVRNSIVEFGFANPLLIDDKLNVIAGNTRLIVAEEMELEEVPCIIVRGWPEEKKKLFNIADNKTAELNFWDNDLLKETLLEFEHRHKFLEIGFVDEELDSLFETDPGKTELPKKKKQFRIELSPVKYNQLVSLISNAISLTGQDDIGEALITILEDFCKIPKAPKKNEKSTKKPLSRSTKK